MSELLREVVRTWCPQKRQEVELTLEGCRSQGCRVALFRVIRLIAARVARCGVRFVC